MIRFSVDYNYVSQWGTAYFKEDSFETAERTIMLMKSASTVDRWTRLEDRLFIRDLKLFLYAVNVVSNEFHLFASDEDDLLARFRSLQKTTRPIQRVDICFG